MKSKKILFRADSSSVIGTGHIMRDLVLAKKYALKGCEIVFATQNLDGNINFKIKEAGYRVEILASDSKKELVKLVKKMGVDLLVIDHYGIDYKQEKYIKNKTGVKILSFDDTYKKHHCDILLNHNIYAKKKKYKKLTPKGCEIRCGAKYTLLRDEFYKQKNKKYKPNKRFSIFIAMGGADTANLNVKILRFLKNFKNLKAYVVTTQANQNLPRLKKYAKNKEWIKLHIDSTKIAKLMAKSDLAIVTPSVVLNEVFYMGLKFIVIKTANNQQEMYNYVKRLGR